MKVLCFSCSPKKEGLTAALLSAFCAQGKGTEITVVRPYETMVKPCVGCGACKEKPRFCVINDKMKEIFALIDEADGIVLASPVYYAGVPAPMKAMIDRCMCLYARRFIHGVDRPRKPCAVLLTGGDGRPAGAEAMLVQIKMFLDVCFGNMIEKELFLGTDEDFSFAEFEQRAQESGRRFFQRKELA